MGIYKAELERAFRLRRFGLAFGVASLILLITYLTTKSHMPEKSYIDHWYYMYVQSYYTYLLPLLVALPHADSLVLDRKEGFLRAILARERFGRTMRAKVFANGIAGALAVSLPLVFSYGLLSLSNRNPLYHPAINHFYLRPQEGFLGVLFRDQPNVFFLAVIGAVLVMGFLWATFGLSTSLIINNRYVAIGAPLMFSSLLQYFVERARRLPWFLAPSESLLRLNFSSNRLLTLEDLKLVLILPLTLLLVSVLLWTLLGRRRRVVAESFARAKVAESDAVPFESQDAEVKTLPKLKKQKANRSFNGWLRYLQLQAKLIIKPYLLIIIVVVSVAVGILFSKITLNASALAFPLPESIDLQKVNAWDVLFSAIGNAFSMGVVFTPMFLFLVSNIQPESAYGQLAGLRVSSRSKMMTAKLALLFLISLVYLCLVSTIILLVARFGFGFTLSPSWSQLSFGMPESVNMLSWWVRKYAMLHAWFRIFLMVFLGFLSLGLLVLGINSLSKRRLVGFFVVSTLVFASFGLAYVLVNVGPVLRNLPIIRNLILPMYPWPWRLGDTTNISLIYWVVWIALLLPLCMRLMLRQEFYSITETE
jgi:hypothetical protein